MVNELRAAFRDMFGERLGGDLPPDDDVVFGGGNRYGLDSMDTLRFVSALLPLYGDKVYDLKVEDVTSLQSIYEQLQGTAEASR